MNLGAQLIASGALVCVMALIHAIGVIGITKALGLDERALRAHRVDFRALGLLVTMALCLFSLHIIEIALFAAFYIGVGAVEGVEPALFFSASAYSTLGTIEASLPNEWRLVGAIEGLVGFLLIGWSTGVFIADMNKLLREELSQPNERNASSSGRSSIRK
ncbi:MAG: two pore domain potassium channel family protein [Pseudomonadota bacterium]|nr:two pore domain potassium channel family protein [Pseudomonadota bacterium]